MIVNPICNYLLYLIPMASLYSAQAAITAREQLNHELDEKGASDYSIKDVTHKEKHNPYHYH